MLNKFTYQHIFGWCDFYHTYSEAVRDAKDNAIFVEIGAWLGKSTAFMAESIKQSGKNITFYTVDTWRGNPLVQEHRDFIEEYGVNGSIFSLFRENMLKANVANFVIPLEMTSENASKEFKDNSLDFIFIDGDHEYESVKLDIECWWPKLKENGVIAGDDYCCGWPGVDKAVDEKFRKLVIKVENIGAVGYTWMVIK